MTEIIVIEPQGLLRLGIMQVLVAMEPDAKIEGLDYGFMTQEIQTQREVDLVVASVSPTRDMSELMHAVKHVYSPKRTLLLSDAVSAPCCMLDFPATIAGSIPKNSSPEILAASIRLILAGGNCFPAPIPSGARTVSNNTMAMPQPIVLPIPTGTAAAADGEAKMLKITPRQYEVLVLLARGSPIKTVSRQLSISLATAKTHVESLYQRLGVHSRNEAVYMAISRGAKLGWAETDSICDAVAPRH